MSQTQAGHPLQSQTGRVMRLRTAIRGAVQGVGFRPFVYRLARELGLSGYVCNSSGGVLVETEGQAAKLEAFLQRLEKDRPPLASIQSLEPSYLDAVGYSAFEIQASQESQSKTALVLPDVASCADCLGEVFDPSDRRFRYPFTNCTNCGPRYSIIEGLPYDRPLTTMKKFPMCDECRAEYEDPLDRRFHAQPNACPRCGPQVELWNPSGQCLERSDEALQQAARMLQRGQIVAVKGLGGFHLMADARDPEVVQRLRRRKRREEKPLALMFPGLEAVKECCHVSASEQRLLRSPEAPIVLLRRRNDAGLIAPQVAPGNPDLGVMLPCTPLHCLLLAEAGFPLVATSGNLSEEPICTDEIEALDRLAGIADCLLVHDRPIARHVDDSIVRVMLGRELVLRRARGYAPLPITLGQPLPPLLAVGGHLKNTVACSLGHNAFISQHIGDLESAPSFDAFRSVIRSFERLYEFEPQAVACDMHPDYRSSLHARQMGKPLVPVQHHHAHLCSCLAENHLEPPVLGVVWDGTGYGLDGTVWGGEFLAWESGADAIRRLAHLRPFPLPGGEKAVREPRRSALGLLYEMLGQKALEQDELAPLSAFAPAERKVLGRMLEGGINSPRTSAAGRLFDALASMAGLRQVSRFEGQAAMELEYACPSSGAAKYHLGIRQPSGDAAAPWIIDWAPMIEQVLSDLQSGLPVKKISSRFHNGLAEVIVQVSLASGYRRVALTGGCFQNRILTERSVGRLREEGLQAYWHQRVPPNDGGISLGQLAAAARELQAESEGDSDTAGKAMKPEGAVS